MNRPRPFQFGLSSLLLAMAVLSVILAISRTVDPLIALFLVVQAALVGFLYLITSEIRTRPRADRRGSHLSVLVALLLVTAPWLVAAYLAWLMRGRGT